MDDEPNAWAAAQRRALARGGLAAGAATGIALLSHLMAGGAMPALPGLLVPLALAFAGCVLLAGVRLRSVRLLLSVGASQLLFHQLFLLGAGHGAAGRGTARHAHHAVTAPVAETHSSDWMFLAHVAATVLTAMALRHGEVLMARLGTTVRQLSWRFLHPVITQPARPTARPAMLVDERAWVPTARLLVRTSMVRRGPPAPAAVPTS